MSNKVKSNTENPEIIKIKIKKPKNKKNEEKIHNFKEQIKEMVETEKIEKIEKNEVLKHLGDFIEEPFELIKSYFDKYLERLVRHQIESFNVFVNYQIQRTIQMFSPTIVKSENDFVFEKGKYLLETHIFFENFKMYSPIIYENNGSTKPMLPHEAKLRNFSYSSAMTIDLKIQYIIRNTESMENPKIIEKLLPKINIGKMPIMLKSSICILSQYKHIEPQLIGECPLDCGGYFIIKGSEKTVLGQERAAENRIYCFDGKNTTKWDWTAEIKSVPDFKCISPKQIDMMVATKNNGFGNPIFVSIPKIKQPIELYVLFRAFGIISDKDITQYILLDIENEKNKELLLYLQASVVESNKYLTQEDALRHITTFAAYTPMNMDKETGALKKREFTVEVLNNDLFPHCSTNTQKIYFLGYMANRLIQTALGLIPTDDRDSYLNKRIELTGTLLNNLFRNYFNKLVKEMNKQVVREINNGSWRSTLDYENIINMTNIYKIIKSTTIENGISRALATGDFSIKQANSSKVGVAQVLSRLTYVSSLSHLRRINTPLEKSGELIAPRKLHNTTWGYLCCAETPEGQSIGIVKNLSYMAHITIPTNSSSLYEYIEPLIHKIENIENYSKLLNNCVKVFINGAWVGVCDNPIELYDNLKEKKYKGIINIYTSIIFDYKKLEIRVCNDGGRLTRPLLKVKDNKALLTLDIVSKIKNKELTWNDLLTNCRIPESVIEYIDPEEQNLSIIAMKSKESYLQNPELKIKYTHCEIHPSTILGVLASCIVFPEHNQSPRNCYQTSMQKQAMGVYSTNFDERMDKTSYVLTYPTKPLVDTRLMNYLQLNKVPSGNQIYVAIATHTGFNQEDSVLINQGSIDRGMFLTTIYHTEVDQDKNIIRDEIIRCKPDKTITKGIKFGNYDKLNSNGFIPENELVENNDIIIAKIVPIKENRNDPTKTIKYEDQSKSYKTYEETYIDKNLTGRNGDGYNFAKVRTRILRKPVIGDKMACHNAKCEVLTNNGWKQITEVVLTDKVCILEPETDNISYEYPSEIHSYDYDSSINGPMYQLKSSLVELTVTHNHRMWVKRRAILENKKFDYGNYEFIEAEKCFGKRLKYKKTVLNFEPIDWIGEIFIIPMFIDGYKHIRQEIKVNMDDWLVFFGIWLAEGCADKNSVIFAAHKPRVKKALEKVIQNMGFTLCKTFCKKSDEIKHSWSIHNVQLCSIMEVLSVGSTNKYFPEWVWKLNKIQSQLLITSMMLGDGYHTKSNSYVYYTSSNKMADDLSRLCLHAGWAAYKRKINSKLEGNTTVCKNGRIITSTTDHLCVTIIKTKLEPEINHGHCHTQNGQSEEWIEYKGTVHCLTVRTGIFMVRVNGKPVWSGNSRSKMCAPNNWRWVRKHPFER